MARLIKDFPKKVVTFNSYIDSPYRLTKTYQESDSAAIFDFNKKEFERNIKICNQLNKEQKALSPKNRRNIYHGYSNVNFDLWLILHKENYNRKVTNNNAYIKDVCRIFKLNLKDNIKNKKTIKKILEQITLKDVKDAITRAENIKRQKIKDDASIVEGYFIYTNPDFSIHEFLKKVLKESGDL